MTRAPCQNALDVLHLRRFFAANLLSPQKYFQIGRLLASGIALAEVCPMTPMPGLRSYQWRRGIRAILFALIVPAFFLMNFIW